MARLFITSRDIDFINDLNKEIVKDVIGQKIYLYPISEIKTKIHDVYREAPEKIFENPISVDARVAWQKPTQTFDKFGYDKKWSVEVMIPSRDMIQREIIISQGDFFSYDAVFYEIVSVLETHNIYGQVEHEGGLHIIGKSSRKENFVSKVFGPTSEKYSDSDAVQDKFYQQRGFENNQEGATGDRRDLQKNGVLDAPLTGPSEVSPRGTLSGSAGSSFYDEQS